MTLGRRFPRVGLFYDLFSKLGSRRSRDNRIDKSVSTVVVAKTFLEDHHSDTILDLSSPGNGVVVVSNLGSSTSSRYVSSGPQETSEPLGVPSKGLSVRDGTSEKSSSTRAVQSSHSKFKPDSISRHR